MRGKYYIMAIDAGETFGVPVWMKGRLSFMRSIGPTKFGWFGAYITCFALSLLNKRYKYRVKLVKNG